MPHRAIFEVISFPFLRRGFMLLPEGQRILALAVVFENMVVRR